MESLLVPEGPLFACLRALHIGAGTVALFAAPVALAVAKGKLAHRRAGWVYIGAMGTVALTALGMALIRPNPFLFLLAIFSFYLVYTGVRLLRLKYREPAKRAPAGLDRVLSGSMAVASMGMLGMAVLGFRGGNGNALVYLVFGVISSLLVVGEFRGRQAAETDRRKWLALHIQRMIGAYIATVTAFSVVNAGHLFPGVPAVVAWLWPTAVGTPLIVYSIARFARAKQPGISHGE